MRILMKETTKRKVSDHISIANLNREKSILNLTSERNLQERRSSVAEINNKGLDVDIEMSEREIELTVGTNYLARQLDRDVPRLLRS